MKTGILVDHEPVDGGRIVRVLLRVEADAPPKHDRLPLNLSLVLDRSGSMHGAKLAAARAAAALLVRRLSPDDVVSVVAYDDSVATIAEPAKGDAQATLPRQVEAIETGGSTNLSGGWLRGRELLGRNRLEGGINRLMLLTDGLANVGILFPQQLTGLAAQGKTDGITTTTIGFGTDYDEHLLRAMADAGGGSMYYIENPDQAASIFGDELQDLIALGAQNVTVTIRPAPVARLTTVHHDYPRTSAGTALTLELGDIYAREPKPLLIELMVAGANETDTTVLDLSVEGDVLTAGGGVERQVVTLPVVLTAGEEVRVEPEVRKDLLLMDAAKARQDALSLSEQGDWDGAAALLRATGAQLREAGLDDAIVAEHAADLSVMASTFTARTVSAADRKYMHQRAYDARRGRRLKEDLIRRMKEEEKLPEA
ncbi:MAG TPA: VWA domain-containing protein [Longimicrobiales bacterium]|nr:VWA domain-containing protein [Longimicrobiales bacterium]